MFFLFSQMLLLSIRDMLFVDKNSTVWQKKIHIKILEDKCFFFCKKVNNSEIQRYILATVTQQTTLPSIATTKQNLSQDQHQLSTETILLNFCRDQHQLSTETILLIFRNDQHQQHRNYPANLPSWSASAQHRNYLANLP